MKKTTYKAKDFARLFRSIPDEQWATGHYANIKGDRKCALGHVGERPGIQCAASNALDGICFSAFRHHAASINDGTHGAHEDFPQPTPKLRMVAAMEKAKELGF